MTSADKIALIAAIAAVISTAISLAAFYVAWLARNDSKKLVAAENQPLIQWQTHSGGIESGQFFKFKNHGAVMRNPKVVVDGGLEGWIEPKDVVTTGEEADLKIKWPKSQKVPKAIKVSIGYTDKFDEQRKIDFKFLAHPVRTFFIHEPEPA